MVDSSTGLADPLVGRVVDGRYAVQEFLARGGMGTVYRALDTRLERLVALKVMAAPFAEDPGFVARFQREAKAAARLSHPNLVAVHDQGHDGDLAYLAMELVEGRTLRQHLRERGRLGPAEALAVVEPVLAALAAVHAAGLVHRDVKPENVLLADDGRVKLADFGLARAADGAAGTVTATVLIGTVAYLAPEQVQRGVADPRSDVYAAGSVLYELLTGEPPFTAPTAVALAYRHVQEDVPAPSTRVPGLPPALDAAVVRATRRDPDARPRDAAALLALLVAARRGEPGQGGGSPGTPQGEHRTQVLPPLEADAAHAHDAAPSPTGRSRRRRRGGDGDRVRRPRRGRRTLVVLVVLLALLAAGGAGVGWWAAARRDVTVPGVVATPLDAARQRLVRDGFTVRAGAPVHSEVPRGDVATQEPPAGARLTRHGTVTLHSSAGPELHAVPALRGLDLAAATARLVAERLRVGQRSARFDDAAEAGRVLSTAPRAGTSLRPGTAVDLVLSRGPVPVAVPDLVGRRRDAAVAALRARGLVPTVTSGYDDRVPAGVVKAQEPAAGGTLHHGDAVRVLVSRGPERVAVPDVRGDGEADALKRLRALGFDAASRHIPGGFSGRVISEDPAPGTRLRKGAAVTLYVF